MIRASGLRLSAAHIVLDPVSRRNTTELQPALVAASILRTAISAGARAWAHEADVFD